MSFNEINAVENFVIHTITGVNLNESNMAHEAAAPYGAQWEYLPATELPREITEVMVETEVKNALVRLIDFERIANNKFQLVNQFSIRNRETRRPDIVLFVNGFSLVVGETKTPVRPSVSWLDAASDIHDGYENSVPELFVPNVFSFATEGRELFYGAVRTPMEFWSAWRLNEGANRIVERVLENKIKRGLIWHFQGSGKSLLMPSPPTIAVCPTFGSRFPPTLLWNPIVLITNGFPMYINPLSPPAPML